MKLSADGIFLRDFITYGCISCRWPFSAGASLHQAHGQRPASVIGLRARPAVPSTTSPLRLCTSTQTRDGLQVKHGGWPRHRSRGITGNHRTRRRSTTTSARPPAERRHSSSRRQRPPQLGHRWSGGTPLRRDVDDYFGLAAGKAAAPLVVNIHLGLVAEWSCDTCPARCPRHVHHHLIARAGY